MNYFAKNVRYLRKKYNMGQEELANKLGYKSFTTIQKWESSDSEPTLSTLNKIANIFNISLKKLVETDLEIENTNEIQDAPTTNPDYFTNAEEAIQFLMQQKVIAASTGINLDDYSEDEITQFANRLLDYARFLDSDKRK